MAPVSDYILRATRYRVIGPVVVVRMNTGGEAYLNKGALIPAQADQRNIEHLLAAKLIEKIEGDK